jgi:hypothetical protein
MANWRVWVDFDATTVVEVTAATEQGAIDEAVSLVESTFVADLPHMALTVPEGAETTTVEKL